MTRRRKRKLKSMIAEIIANLLIFAISWITGIIVINIGSSIVVALHITYEQFREAMIVISLIGTVTAVIILLRKNERSEKNGRK